MANHGKKYKEARAKVEKSKPLVLQEALQEVKDLAWAKFDESVDVDVNLGIDPTKGEQVVRGSLLLPHSTGKQVKIAVFAKGEHAEKAQKAGADYVGAEDLVAKIEQGWLDFNYAIATPDLMGLVGKIAKILGPRGLVPNKKTGTVTFDVESVVADLKKGRKFFKNDKMGVVHFSIGKVSFETGNLVENLSAFLKSLLASKPASSKGKFIKKITVASTMGPGVPVSPEGLS